jgi:hypothetical protein
VILVGLDEISKLVAKFLFFELVFGAMLHVQF